MTNNDEYDDGDKTRDWPSYSRLVTKMVTIFTITLPVTISSSESHHLRPFPQRLISPSIHKFSSIPVNIGLTTLSWLQEYLSCLYLSGTLHSISISIQRSSPFLNVYVLCHRGSLMMPPLFLSISKIDDSKSPHYSPQFSCISLYVHRMPISNCPILPKEKLILEKLSLVTSEF